jgi:alcohol dehydrogenase
MQVLGVHIDGGLRDRFVVRADKLHPSAKLTYDQLALVETLAVGRHATGRGQPQAGEHVLIIGLGPIGLATLEFVALTDSRVTVMDVNADRLDFCQRNYDVSSALLYRGDKSELSAMKDLTEGELFRVVFDATGNIQSMCNAVQYVAHTGTLVYVGLTTQEISFPNPLFHARELTIKATRNALPQEFREIIQLLEQGRIDTDRWITHHTAFDDMIEVFESYTRPETGVVKAVVQVN